MTTRFSPEGSPIERKVGHLTLGASDVQSRMTVCFFPRGVPIGVGGRINSPTLRGDYFRRGRSVSTRKRIVYVQYTNPAAYPPLERSSRLLADDGWEVLVLGLLRPGTEALRFPPHPHISERYAFNATTGWRLRLHYAWFVVWVLCWTLRWRARWVYASDLLACPMALLSVFCPAFAILYHEHDEPAPRRGVFARAQRLVRQLASRRADLRVLPNAERAHFFEQTVCGGKPTSARCGTAQA